MLERSFLTRLVLRVLTSGRGSLAGADLGDVMSAMIRGDLAVETRAVRLFRAAVATARADDRGRWYEFRGLCFCLVISVCIWSPTGMVGGVRLTTSFSAFF